MDSSKSQINPEFDKITKRLSEAQKNKCQQHNLKINQVCTQRQCIDKNNNLLCHTCAEKHINHKIYAVSEIFSTELLDDIKESLKEKLQINQFNMMLVDIIDRIYDDFENQVEITLKNSRESIKKKVGIYSVGGQLEKLKIDLVELYQNCFDENAIFRLKNYLKSYSDLADRFIISSSLLNQNQSNPEKLVIRHYEEIEKKLSTYLVDTSQELMNKLNHFQINLENKKEPLSVKRFRCYNSDPSYSWRYKADGSSIDGISFISSHDIIITGFGLYTPLKVGDVLDGTIRLMDGNCVDQDKIIISKEVSVKNIDRKSDDVIYKVMFNVPINLKKNKIYSCVAQLKGGNSDNGLEGCKNFSIENGINIKFENYVANNNCTDLSKGQIPEIYFEI